MQFFNEQGHLIDHGVVEANEQRLAQEHILPTDRVLELGARYGSVSCTINKILDTSLNQVVVEPDPRVWEALRRNMSINGCLFHIVQGFISRRPLNVILKGYDTGFEEDKESPSSCFTLETIESMSKLQFNVLVADCEGFLETFFDENPKLYKDLRLVIFEEDQVHMCDYDKIRSSLKEHGFEELLSGHQNVWKKP